MNEGIRAVWFATLMLIALAIGAIIESNLSTMPLGNAICSENGFGEYLGYSNGKVSCAEKKPEVAIPYDGIYVVEVGE